MTMTKTAFAFTIVALLFVSFAPILGYAQKSTTDVRLPDPGVLPDNPFYGLKKAFESIGMSFTFGDDAKSQKALEIAQTRLAEAQAMVKAGKPGFVDSLLQEYSQGLDNANKIAASLEDGDKKEAVTEKVAIATSRHLSVLDDLQERVPENATTSIAAAREHSIQGNQQALKALAAENPERAAEIAMQVAENRANKVKEAAESGDRQEAIRAADEYQEYEHFGDDIAAIAGQDGKNATRVQEIVSTARSNHLTVLEGVLDKVPEGAKPTIQQVIADSEERLEASSASNSTSTSGQENDSEHQRNADSASDSEDESSSEDKANGGNDEGKSSSATAPAEKP